MRDYHAFKPAEQGQVEIRFRLLGDKPAYGYEVTVEGAGLGRFRKYFHEYVPASGDFMWLMTWETVSKDALLAANFAEAA